MDSYLLIKQAALFFEDGLVIAERIQGLGFVP